MTAKGLSSEQSKDIIYFTTGRQARGEVEKERTWKASQSFRTWVCVCGIYLRLVFGLWRQTEPWDAPGPGDHVCFLRESELLTTPCDVTVLGWRAPYLTLQGVFHVARSLPLVGNWLPCVI